MNDKQESIFSTSIAPVHERAMRAVEVAIVCGFKGKTRRQEFALRYALQWELHAVSMALIESNFSVLGLLQKSAAAIAIKCYKLDTARQLVNAALANVPKCEKHLKADIKKLNLQLCQLEEASGLPSNRSWLRRLFNI